MKITRILASLTLVAGLSACDSNDLASRGVPAPAAFENHTAMSGASDWVLSDVQVHVPHTLPTTEADVYYPRADLVWHGDPAGDRYAQVEALIDRGLTAGAAALNGTRPVIVEVTVRRFHSVTPKTRNSVGGVHNILFDMQVLDAATGQPLTMKQTHAVDVKAYGGRKALVAERQGYNQKVRIMGHLQQWFQQQFGIEGASQTVALR